MGLRKDVMALRGNFNGLMQEQKTLGFDDSSGLRENLQVAGNAVERIINENMSGLAEADATTGGAVVHAPFRSRLPSQPE